MGDLYRHHSVGMLFNVLTMHDFPIVEEEGCLSGHVCCRCCHPEGTSSGTCDAFCVQLLLTREATESSSVKTLKTVQKQIV